MIRDVLKPFCSNQNSVYVGKLYDTMERFKNGNNIQHHRK